MASMKLGINSERTFKVISKSVNSVLTINDTNVQAYILGSGPPINIQ